MDAVTTVDLQYTSNLGELSIFSDTEVTLGIQNLTNEDTPWIPFIMGYEGTLHDPKYVHINPHAQLDCLMPTLTMLGQS